MNEFDVPGSESPHYTEAWPILSGTMNLSGSEIPFFQAMIPLKSVVDQLDLVENLPSDLRANWRLEELFQREIDWERVREDLVKGYLKRPNKLKFFSTLTVALLPLDDEGMLASEYGETLAAPTALEWAKSPIWKTKSIGSVEVVTHASAPNGALRWDPRKIFAATIDGQHRLAALKDLVKDGHLSSKTFDSKLSVMFLVLDPRAGFVLADGQTGKDDNPILTVVREIFIDLNMHSKTVARARQILLSDQDIEARCLRELIAARVGEEEPGRLPLGLIHWQHNESAKFNIAERTAPFITTVELMYAIIKDILDIKRPKDPLDPDQIRKFVSSIDAGVGLDAYLKKNTAKYQLKSLASYVEEHHLKKDFESSFPNPSSPYVRAIADSFSALWRPIILDVLTKFQPYSTFIDEVRARGGLTGDIAFYMVQPKGAQKLSREQWGEDTPAKIDEPLAELHKLKTADWAFYAVFQKALFRATKSAYQHYSVVPGYTQQPFSDAWVSFLNEMAAKDAFKVKASIGGTALWAGVGLSPVGNAIAWSEASVQRISSLITLWWYFYVYKLTAPNTFIKKVTAAQGAERFPGSKPLLVSLKRGIDGLVKAQYPDLSEVKLNKRVNERLNEIIGLARNASADGANDTELETLSDDPGVMPVPEVDGDIDEQSETLTLPNAE
ncbi:DNA sulfur modification protein DndB [Sphingomonas sp. Leaf4]|uniref:DNA sulfur modification protein DndB n=1 Tax=Sphingomonas sp. Leaf4 TaxID=2876553 RepID=UPI001E5FCC21|nr:DNA sulfur modification protein DndB [Sphingomonas sp. Leaf4]